MKNITIALLAAQLFLAAQKDRVWTNVESQPGTFTPAGNMTTPRSCHSSTLLANGKVLIAGGNVNGGPPLMTVASAELYDPTTGTFTLTGSMTTPRCLHSAILLPDGKVLIAGGEIADSPQPHSVVYNPLASAELYDPNTGTFSATGDMTTARSFNLATLLANGKVLIAGGDGTGLWRRAELYDPATGTFTATGNMTNDFAQTATLLANGKVLITRGDVDAPLPQSSADLYDPATGMFSSLGFMNAFHNAPTATPLLNGKVLIAGGDIGDGDGSSHVAELFDPSSGTFTVTGSIIDGREGNTATLLPLGAALFAGGDLSGRAEVYDPNTLAFSSTGIMTAARYQAAATLLSDGRVLFAGGSDLVNQTLLSTAEIYTPSALSTPPALLSLSGDGRGQGAIQHAATYQIASAANPAVAGEYLAIYLTGLAEGSVVPPQVAIGGRFAEVVFFGDVAGYPGLNQVNVQVPDGIAAGPAVPVRLSYLNRTSNEVTIGMQ